MDLDLDQRLIDLMRRAQDGDRRSYEALLTEVTGLVRAYVRRRLREADALEDIVQETLLSIHRNRHTYDPARSFHPWMYAIAKNRLLDHLRKQQRRSVNEVPGGPTWESLPPRDPVVEPTRPTDLIKRALALLSRKQREIIEMLKIEGWSVAEIARKKGLSQSSVKVTAHRGYKRIRELIERPAHDE